MPTLFYVEMLKLPAVLDSSWQSPCAFHHLSCGRRHQLKWNRVELHSQDTLSTFGTLAKPGLFCSDITSRADGSKPCWHLFLRGKGGNPFPLSWNTEHAVAVGGVAEPGRRNLLALLSVGPLGWPIPPEGATLLLGAAQKRKLWAPTDPSEHVLGAVRCDRWWPLLWPEITHLRGKRWSEKFGLALGRSRARKETRELMFWGFQGCLFYLI